VTPKERKVYLKLDMSPTNVIFCPGLMHKPSPANMKASGAPLKLLFVHGTSWTGVLFYNIFAGTLRSISSR